MCIMQIGKITVHATGSVSCDGLPAVQVFRLVTLASGLKLEMKCPGLKLSRHGSALKFAKPITGLKTNDRAKHLERVELMLEEARKHVVYLNEDPLGMEAGLRDIASGRTS
jgi:hypothetical protein